MAGSNARFLCQKLVYLIHSVSLYLRPILSFISTYIFRLDGQGSDSLKKRDNEINFLETESELLPEDKAEEDAATELIRDNDGDDDGDKEGVYLKFKFQTYEEFIRIQKRAADIFNNSKVVPCVKNEFTSGKSSISTFIDELADTVPVKQEINAAIDGIDEKGSSDKDLMEEMCDCENIRKETLVFDVEENQKSEPQLDKGIEGNINEEYRIFSDGSSVITDSDSVSISFEQDGFLSDGDFVGELDEKTESEDFGEEDSDIMEELKKLEEHNNLENPDFLSEKDFNEDLGDTSEKTRLDNDSSMSESDDDNKLESLWEHQELIEQLRMELKKVRATGLPTILEESESPKMMDDLKPWKIDDFQRGDCIGELHKFYKSYRDRMRKFDIINYQKMYAMGFLQLKDPLQPTQKQKSSPPSLKSLVSQNLWLFKHKIHGSDPMKKFILELQGDLEAVYVGQMCLSWEFLHWQYEKVLDLWDSDPRGTRRYNEVAGEFQQFQVLMQRFMEDEPFQGPRVENYVKTRCAVRNLLQVPVIREDKLREKRKKDMGDEYVITSDMLVEIVEESIRIFWKFVRADKECLAPPINCRHKKISNLLPSLEQDSKLLVEVKRILQKKEKKVKELLRCENCILRKLRRCKEDDDGDSDQVLYFFSQVDMKLVCRVLNMSKITRDQLVWCHNKLNRISFVNNKVRVEPAFLLFPC